MAPAVGVVIGAFCHFMIQFPLSYKLGFRFTGEVKPNDEVKKIGKLAVPRVIDVSVEQIQRTVELFLATLVSTASYTYYTFATSLQILPVGLFGTSIAKASLPLLSSQADEPNVFRATLLKTIYQAIFLTLPVVSLMLVLHIPIVRLVYGTSIFDWTATVQTGWVVTAFAFGIPFQVLVTIMSRAFFALHDTKTPVAISLIGMILIVLGDFIGIKVFSMPVWVLAFSISVGAFIETIILSSFLHKRISGIYSIQSLKHIAKPIFSALVSGTLMYILLKLFDKSVWLKRLSFVSSIQDKSAIPFEKFVLDTRYTINLLILTASVALVGALVYLGLSYLLKSEELVVFLNLVKRTLLKHKVAPIPEKEPEPGFTNDN